MALVKVTGLGAACANGLSKETIYDSCSAPATAVGEEGLASLKGFHWNELRETTPEFLRGSKCTVLAYRSLAAALEESRWNAEELRNAGFIFASTTSQIDQWEKDLPFYRNPDHPQEKLSSSVANQSLGTPAIKIAQQLGILGPLAVVASSCSASLQAVALASLWIRSGKVQRCLVGATEIHNDLTRVGFGSLRLLSKNVARPFDKNRGGINLGEASAFLCLEKADLQDDPSWGFIRGAGLSTDAYHVTAPHPEGRGSLIAMQMALKNSELTAKDIQWIYAHGTGSAANDLSEAKAIEQIFSADTLVTSTKSSHGHTLGACGALESVLGLMALKKNEILPTYNFHEADPQIHLHLTTETLRRQYQTFIKNSLGFGGINASVVFSKDGGRP